MDQVITITEGGVAITPAPEHERMAHQVAITYVVGLKMRLKPEDYSNSYLEVYRMTLRGLEEVSNE